MKAGGWVLTIGGAALVLGILFAAGSADAMPTPGVLPPPPGGDDPKLVVWPLPEWPLDAVQEWRTGARTFGATRKTKGNIKAHVHAGVDLGPPSLAGVESRAWGSEVRSPVSGRVEIVGGGWDGPQAKRIEIVSPIYGRIVLGAVKPEAAVAVGDLVVAGQLVGWVGRYPGGSTMLHLEQHDGKRTKWATGTPQPKTIHDPRTGVLARFV